MNLFGLEVPNELWDESSFDQKKRVIFSALLCTIVPKKRDRLASILISIVGLSQFKSQPLLLENAIERIKLETATTNLGVRKSSKTEKESYISCLPEDKMDERLAGYATLIVKIINMLELSVDDLIVEASCALVAFNHNSDLSYEYMFEEIERYLPEVLSLLKTLKERKDASIH